MGAGEGGGERTVAWHRRHHEAVCCHRGASGAERSARARALSQPLSLSLSLSLSASQPLSVSLSEYLSRPLSRSLYLYISRLSQSPSVSLSTCVLPRGCPAIGVPRTPCDDRARPRINGSLRKSIAKAAIRVDPAGES